jgi:hypothetical protein
VVDVVVVVVGMPVVVVMEVVVGTLPLLDVRLMRAISATASRLEPNASAALIETW